MVYSCGVRRWEVGLEARGAGFAWLRLLNHTEEKSFAPDSFTTPEQLANPGPKTAWFRVVALVPLAHDLVDVVGIHIDFIGVAGVATHEEVFASHDDLRHRAAHLAVPKIGVG